MIGSRFNGIVEQINYFPQSVNTNRSPWKNMETEWRTTQEGIPANNNVTPPIPAIAGQDVHVNIKVEFTAGSNNRRPIRFIVNFEYGGNPQPEKRILNP
jgi:hypothetical protein